MKSRRNANRARDLSLQRMERLFELASQEHGLHPERSDRYIQIARQISTRIRVRMPRHLKRRACSHCGCYLPASGVRVRLRRGQVTATCLRCGEQTRHPYRERTQEPSKPRVSPSSIS